MRGIASALLLSCGLLSVADTASAQWRWRDDGTPELIGPSRWSRQPAPQGWGRPAWLDQPTYAAPLPQAGGEELRDGGPRPVIEPINPPLVAFNYPYPPNSIVIDSDGKRLYFVLPGQQAFVYQVSVGREGFDWTGTEVITRKQAWPDWHPPAEMRARDPSLPIKMTGGIRNPLGAMALYLGNTLYRIRGTDNEATLGQAGSSGCFRMANAAVLHLASIADVGTTVHVVRSLAPPRMSGSPRPPVRIAEPPVPKAGPPPRARRDAWSDWDRFPDTRQYGGWR